MSISIFFFKDVVIKQKDLPLVLHTNSTMKNLTLHNSHLYGLRLSRSLCEFIQSLVTAANQWTLNTGQLYSSINNNNLWLSSTLIQSCIIKFTTNYTTFVFPSRPTHLKLGDWYQAGHWETIENCENRRVICDDDDDEAWYHILNAFCWQPKCSPCIVCFALFGGLLPISTTTMYVFYILFFF
jgi:hypothetical protein